MSGRQDRYRLDKELYKWRHLIENFFAKPKEFKRIVMCVDKTDPELRSLHQSCSRRHKLSLNLNKLSSAVEGGAFCAVACAFVCLSFHGSTIALAAASPS